MKAFRFSLTFLVAMVVAAGLYYAGSHKQEPNTVRFTYELRGVQTTQVMLERDIGPLGLLGPVAFVMMHNDLPSYMGRPIRKVVGLEYCVRGIRCSDWMPRQQADGRWKVGSL
jgi:hypothetical protein